MTAAYHFLVANGLWTACVWTVVAGSIAWLFARHPIRKLLTLLALHTIHQAQIADRLDTATDGGLRDVLDAIESTQPPSKRPSS